MNVARASGAPTTSYADERRRPTRRTDVVHGGGIGGPILVSPPSTVAEQVEQVQAQLDARRGARSLDGHPTNPGGLSSSEFVARRDAQWQRVAKLADRKGMTADEILILGVQFSIDAYKLFASGDGATAAEVDALGKQYRQRLRGSAAGGGAGGARGLAS